MGRSIFGPSIDVTTKAMTFLEERHRLIANNIANAGTPFYKAQDAPVEEFQRALAEAIEARRERPSRGLVLDATPHIRDGGYGLEIRPRVRTGGASILRHDGNNVNLETEMSELAQNSLMHGVLAQVLRKQFLMLKAAIAERVDV